MKHLIFIILVFSIIPKIALANMQQCLTKDNCQSVFIEAPVKGDIYIDGKFTGHQAPTTLSLAIGKRLISVGSKDKKQYYRQQFIIAATTEIARLTPQHLAKPNVWRALFVGVPTATGHSPTGYCQTHFTKEDLDQAYAFFTFNLRDHIEKFSMGTVQWEIERRDLTNPVELSFTKTNRWYTLEAEQALAEFNDLAPGDYDNIFYIWREEDGSCRFNSDYFGLAWLDPLSAQTKKTGYVTVKFNPENIGMAAKLAQYKQNDPGVWTHEWLHVVVEQFYPALNVEVPIAPQNSLILHAAGAYGYQYPWLKWYEDLISGQIPVGKSYRGIGPEILLHCSIRQAALHQCPQQK